MIKFENILKEEADHNATLFEIKKFLQTLFSNIKNLNEHGVENVANYMGKELAKFAKNRPNVQIVLEKIIEQQHLIPEAVKSNLQEGFKEAIIKGSFIAFFVGIFLVFFSGLGEAILISLVMLTIRAYKHIKENGFGRLKDDSPSDILSNNSYNSYNSY